MSDSSNARPTCLWVWEHPKFNIVCRHWCTCYRANRPADDTNHCFRMLLAINGERGFCTRDLEGLQRAYPEALKKKQGG